MKKTITIVLLACNMVLAGYAQLNLQPIAEVHLSGRTPITLGQLKTRINAFEKEIGRAMTFEERKQLLDTLINERLIVQAAEKNNIKISDSEVNNFFDTHISNQLGRKITEAEFARIIQKEANKTLDEYMKSQNGMTLREFKLFLKSYLTSRAYVMQKKQKDMQSIPVPTDKEIRSFYEINKQSFFQPDTVRLFLVVVPKGSNAAAAEKTIQTIHKKLTANLKNTDSIHKNSLEKNAGYQAGEVFVSKTELAAQQMGISMDELLKIFDMKQDTVSPITMKPSDYRCFIVKEKKAAKILSLSDVVEPGSNISLYEFIKNRVMADKQQQAFTAALTDLTNELHTSKNFTIFKNDAALKNLLTW